MVSQHTSTGFGYTVFRYSLNPAGPFAYAIAVQSKRRTRRQSKKTSVFGTSEPPIFHRIDSKGYGSFRGGVFGTCAVVKAFLRPGVGYAFGLSSGQCGNVAYDGPISNLTSKLRIMTTKCILSVGGETKMEVLAML
jgi:hypothetical protein